jgi:hypothetical protein
MTWHSLLAKQWNSPAIKVSLVAFEKESLIPFAIDVPMLHCVRYIRSLNQMFNNNRGFAINNFFWAFLCGLFRESFGPAIIAQSFQLLIYNISSHDRVNNQLPEVPILTLCGIYCLAQLGKLIP